MSLFQYTAILRKVVGKKVHATVPKGNAGYDQYTVPDDCSCQTYFYYFPLALANTFPWPFVPILSSFVEKKRTQNHPQCLSRLLCALFPTTFLETAVYSGQCWIFTSPLHRHGKYPPLVTFASVNNNYCYLYKCMCFLWHEEKVLQNSCSTESKSVARTV